MARPRLSEQQKLANALAELHQVLGSERGVVRGKQIKNTTRVLLLERGYLREILKGWYFVSDPLAAPGDTTPFFANYWEYLASYLSERFGSDYCLTAEHSLLRQAHHNVVPKQLNVMLAVKQSQIQELAFGHSVALYPGGKSFPPAEDQETLMGVRCMSAPYCLVMLNPRYFKDYAREVQIVMGKIEDPSAIAAQVDVNATGVARLVAAYRRIGRNDFAEDILRQLSGLKAQLQWRLMPAGGRDVETKTTLAVDDDPFAGEPVYQLGMPGRSPLYTRIKVLWAQHRETVLATRPQQAVMDVSADAYLARVDAIRIEDAYHSLSIERYRVTPDLIRKVAEEQWNPVGNPEDQRQIDAMAARGYLDAFEWVKEDAGQAFSGKDSTPGLAARLFNERHQAWFQKLFGPSVDAGILERRDLVGYRRHMVFLRGSLHSPPHFDYVRDGMEALRECIADEPDAFVRAVLGHWLFGFVHPYMDGNGRMARFTMNLMLASGGYPWTVIRVDDRSAYMAALEKASVADDLATFSAFVAGCVRASL
ncbi:MAG: Fic family protein [Sulfuritalea sp.]|nr:Fic family protein [Sulfuritalea sp.]